MSAVLPLEHQIALTMQRTTADVAVLVSRFEQLVRENDALRAALQRIAEHPPEEHDTFDGDAACNGCIEKVWIARDALRGGAR